MRDMVVLVELNGACCRSMARKLRAEHIYCKILPATATAEEILAQDPLGVLLAGGDTGEPAVFPEGCGWTKKDCHFWPWGMPPWACVWPWVDR